MTQCEYVLVTPARNEEAFITGTIEAVLAQSKLPKKWIIVNDRSTDGTGTIVERFAKQHRFITLLQTTASAQRSFSSKVNAFRMGARELSGSHFDYIGNLDADVSFQPNYYEELLQRCRVHPKLGIAGGIIKELIDGKFVQQRISDDSVAGAVQLFRAVCYEEIGGYIPLRYGGIDSAAEIMARMRAWDVKTFRDIEVYHHRRVSSGEGGLVRTKLRHGMRHYSLGYHPLFELLRCIHKAPESPYIVGSVLMAAGYLWGWTLRLDMDLPQEVVGYVRREQADKIRARVLGRPMESVG